MRPIVAIITILTALTSFNHALQIGPENEELMTVELGPIKSITKRPRPTLRTKRPMELVHLEMTSFDHTFQAGPENEELKMTAGHHHLTTKHSKGTKTTRHPAKTTRYPTKTTKHPVKKTKHQEIISEHPEEFEDTIDFSKVAKKSEYIPIIFCPEEPCPLDLECVNFRCRMVCENNEFCPAGYNCIDEICQLVPHDSIVETIYQNESEESEEAEYLSNKKERTCKPPCTSQQYCDKTTLKCMDKCPRARCRPRMMCVNGRCVEKSKLTESYLVGELALNSLDNVANNELVADSHKSCCPSNHRCNPQNPLCKYLMVENFAGCNPFCMKSERYCNNEHKCPPKYFCLINRCKRIQCGPDKPCPKGKFCFIHLCVKRNSNLLDQTQHLQPMKCSITKQCPAGQICRGNRCTQFQLQLTTSSQDQSLQYQHGLRLIPCNPNRPICPPHHYCDKRHRVCRNKNHAEYGDNLAEYDNNLPEYDNLPEYNNNLAPNSPQRTANFVCGIFYFCPPLMICVEGTCKLLFPVFHAPPKFLEQFTGQYNNHGTQSASLLQYSDQQNVIIDPLDCGMNRSCPPGFQCDGGWCYVTNDETI